MSGQSWATAADVRRWEAEMLGHGVFDDRFIIRGAQPPPPRRDLDVDDDELRLRYGNYDEQIDLETIKPDLTGIQAMLRMKDEFETNQDDEIKPDTRLIISKQSYSSPIKKWQQSQKNKQAVITTSPSNIGGNKRGNISPIEANSKLNPEVPSFIPKQKNSSSIEPLTSEDKNNLKPTKYNDIDAAVVLESPKTNDFGAPNTSQNNGSGDNDKTNSNDKTNGNDKTNTFTNECVYVDPAEILKKKIIEASRADRKREKNVAMAALLKLKTSSRISTPNMSPKRSLKTEEPQVSIDNAIEAASKSSSPKNLVLFTPEYFEKVTATETAVTEKPAIEPVFVETTPELLDSTENQQEEQPSPEEIRESLIKVQNWLEPEKKPVVEKPKPKTLYLNPVMFKRKSAASASPVSVKQEEEIKRNKSDPVPSYVPSAYAMELVKKYEENAKIQQGQVDIFTKLEADLKARDEEIRKKRQNQSSETLESQDSNEQS